MQDFVTIDFETANSKRSSVCVVGIVVVRDGEIADRFYSLIRTTSITIRTGPLRCMGFPGPIPTLNPVSASHRKLRLPGLQLHIVVAACDFYLENHHHALADQSFFAHSHCCEVMESRISTSVSYER